MTLYAKIENGSIAKYPYNLGDLRSDNKNTSFPKDALSRSDVAGMGRRVKNCR